MTQLSRTQIFVNSLPDSLAFYQNAFDFAVRYEHESGQYAELDAGGFRLALGTNAIGEMTFGDSGYSQNNLSQSPAGIFLGISVDDVDTAYQKAIEAGGASVKEPFTQPWGQQLAYVRDNSGVLIEIEKFTG
ncbi:MAG: VOC family protein [Chloroflexota bacterium]